MELVDSVPLANMGDGNTLGEVLSWGVQTYPAHLELGEASSFTFGEFIVSGAPVVEEAPLSDFAVLTSHGGEITVEMAKQKMWH